MTLGAENGRPTSGQELKIPGNGKVRPEDHGGLDSSIHEDTDAGPSTSTPEADDSESATSGDGHSADAPHDFNSATGQGATDGSHQNGQFSAPTEQGLGILLEHKQDQTNQNPRTSVVDVFGGQKAKAALAEIAKDISKQPADDKEKVLKLSPEKIQELTSSPESIPYRAVAPENTIGRRVVSENIQSNGSHIRPDMKDFILQALSETPPIVEKIRSIKDIDLDASAPMSPAATRNVSNAPVRNRPQPSRTFSTPGLSRRPISSTPSSERLLQTGPSRSKDRPGAERDLKDLKSQLAASPQFVETPLTSPMPPAIPLPPVSIPTYLQLELASGRPSPLYIHRSSTTDFPYESSSAKIERLFNVLFLPWSLEQVLCFGTLACLDSWLYSFTILPLRFAKAVYMLFESLVMNLDAEMKFVWRFVLGGVGRMWRRRQHPAELHGERRGSEPDATPRLPNGSSNGYEGTQADKEARHRHSEPTKRRHRASESRRRHHRRKKSIPSALLPDDKADILTGLLMIATCWALMYFDASRMYHWIRGQAAIKLYVIYNVLEVSDRLLSALGQDVLECLFSREALERRPDGRSKIFRPFWLFLLALGYTVAHAVSLFYQVMTLNVAVNSYSNALITLLLSNQFVEIKSTVFRKFEKENLFQLTCADVVERFQLWLMLTIIASRNIVETGAFNFIGDLGLGTSFSSQPSTITNSTPLSTPPRTASSILPQSFTFFPSSILSSFNNVNSFIPTLAQVLGPFLVVLGSEMFVDWLKHAYINKFNNYRPALYGRYLDVLAKDYYTNAFGDQNLTRRLGLPVIPLSCLFFRISVQTYQMFLASLLPQHPSSTAHSSLSSIHNHYAPLPLPSTPPLTLRTILPASAAHINSFFRTLLENAIPSPAQSVQIFTVVLLITGFIVLLILKLLLGMVLLAFARSRYKTMKPTETEQRTEPRTEPRKSSHSSSHPQPSTEAPAPRKDEFTVDGARRAGGWGMVEVGDEKRRWIYGDDPEGLRRVKEKEDKDKNKDKDLKIDHVQRYEMVAKKIW